MTTTIRPNVRRVTSSRAIVRTHIANMITAVGIAGSLWAGLFLYITR